MISYTTYWWWGEDLNLRRLSRQIYSLIPLTTREPLPKIKPAIVLYALMSVNINTSFNRDSRPLLRNGSQPHEYTCRQAWQKPLNKTYLTVLYVISGGTP